MSKKAMVTNDNFDSIGTSAKPLLNVFATNLYGDVKNADGTDKYTPANSAEGAAAKEVGNILSTVGLSHNGIYRGKNLGTFTSVAAFEAFLTAHEVSSGKFTDLYLGDYFTIQDGTYNKEWEIAGFDHYLHKGDTDFATHHLVLIPKTNLFTAGMNDSNTTANGYAGSKMHTTHIPTINTKLATVLGNHLLTRRELLTTSMSTSLASMAGAGQTGASNNWAWSDVKAVLPNEVEIYGCTALSSSFYDVGIGCEKLPLFNFKGHSHAREYYWLRAVASSTGFCYADNFGGAYPDDASDALGVRPLICVG
ncbi:hypothetical protein [Anaerovibrio sp. RM50]|uniref:hypothetical protein n=1 Tax=Anaerovibrio sp. RM50 TaxID=1200557 RepID=UPI000685EBAB|nr:hypothetical protein [Anaerovibrio sp. RM50]